MMNRSGGYPQFWAQRQGNTTADGNCPSCPARGGAARLLTFCFPVQCPRQGAGKSSWKLGSVSRYGGELSSSQLLPNGVPDWKFSHHKASSTEGESEALPGTIPKPDELNCPWVAATSLLWINREPMVTKHQAEAWWGELLQKYKKGSKRRGNERDTTSSQYFHHYSCLHLFLLWFFR